MCKFSLIHLIDIAILPETFKTTTEVIILHHQVKNIPDTNKGLPKKSTTLYFLLLALKPGRLLLFDSGVSTFSGLRRFTLRSN